VERVDILLFFDKNEPVAADDVILIHLYLWNKKYFQGSTNQGKPIYVNTVTNDDFLVLGGGGGINVIRVCTVKKKTGSWERPTNGQRKESLPSNISLY
jgi:hypothetical protein